MPLEFKIRYLFVRCTFITKLTDGVAVITAITQANDIKENPKEDFGEEEMLKQSNDTIITPKDVQVNENGTIFYDHHRLIYIKKISELIKKVEDTEIFKFKEIYRCNINEDELEDIAIDYLFYEKGYDTADYYDFEFDI